MTPEKDSVGHWLDMQTSDGVQVTPRLAWLTWVDNFATYDNKRADVRRGV